MLWPLVLPMQITLCVLIGWIFFAAILSQLFKWNLGKTILASSLFALVVSIPLCAGIGSALNSIRFGVFRYESFVDVQDFRVERYLPPNAHNITLDKEAMGHRARYQISPDDLTTYLDGQWHDWGKRSSVSRDELPDGNTIPRDQFEHAFAGLDWALPEFATHYHSPVQSDGGGADYYFDEESGTVFQHAGYW